ncbi:MAG: diaminopimelate decarboxylase [Halodesulfurarchaeum sp.]
MTGTIEAVRRLADWDPPLLRSIAAEHGTPVYVIDLDRVEANLERLRGAFPGASIHYAAKANAGRAVLSTLLDSDAGVECASAGEVTRALDAGFDGEDVLYTPVNPPARDLDTVISHWQSNQDITVTVDAEDTIERLSERGFDGQISIRIHPGIGAGHSESVSTGGDAKFGVPPEEVEGLARIALDRGLDVVGLHVHVGSGILDEDIPTHRAVVERLASVVESVSFDPSFVDVGGGFGVPYRPSEDPLDLSRIARETRDALESVSATLVIEPGRYLVADAGVLLTRVNTTKTSNATETSDAGYFAGVDAGMSDFLRPALYDSYHEIRNLEAGAADRPSESVSVVGPICESTDIFAAHRPLPRPERGDLLAIGNAGAYGIEMANQYNSRPRPSVVALENGEDRLVRRREAISDITATEVSE